MQGREIPYKLKVGSTAINNYVAALELVNNRVNKQIDKPSREQWTLEELQAAKDSLPDVLNKLVRLLKKAQSEAKNAR